MFAELRWREWRALLWLSLAGNIVYYDFLAQAVRRGGVAMASIVIGLLPIAVTLAATSNGSRDAHAPSLRRLAASLALSLAGLLCIGWQALVAPGADTGALAGLLCAVGALVSWTLDAVANSRCLGRLQAVSAHEWSLLTGLVTGIEALLLGLPAFHAAAPGQSGQGPKLPGRVQKKVE